MRYVHHDFFEKSSQLIRSNTLLFGLFSLLWFVLRTGTKPSRVLYPCQKIAVANSYLWVSTYLLPGLFALSWGVSKRFSTKNIAVAVLTFTIATTTLSYGAFGTWRQPPGTMVSLRLDARAATSQPASNIFVVNGTSGNDGGVKTLLDLMGDHGLPFYQSTVRGTNRGPNGLIAKDDVIIIKVNCQWDERGGTNTDLLKTLIQAILTHPDGYSGEIIVADNGQGRGSLDWNRNNAEDTSQSAQTVVDFFAGSHRVSTYLWDKIAGDRVKEYREGDLKDGYIVNETASSKTGLKPSYPKFKTRYGTHVSFKLGIWDQGTGTYDSDRLKVINVPVLKTHSSYGVTACVKHYMGVASQTLTDAHSSVGNGGMGTEMVETRFPVLNILDAIWVNAAPNKGPGTDYGEATRVNIIAASTDPIALDYWASKHILLQTARIQGHPLLFSMDPDNTLPTSYGKWLRKSMDEMKTAGREVTVDESHMNVYAVRADSREF